MRKVRCLMVTGLVALYVTMSLMNPLRRPVSHIRKNILELTPIGTNIAEVTRAIEDNANWRTMYKQMDRGYSIPSYPPGSNIVGSKHIVVDLGKSSLIWYVRSYWGFDENDILVDVYVTKGTTN